MTIFQIIKVLPFLPFAWIDSIRYQKKSREESYYKLQEWSIRILKVLGYRLDAFGIENINNDDPVLFVSNHQGTLDPVLIVATSPIPISFISKKENEKLPIFGRWAKNIQTIHFDRKTREGNVFMLREAARYLRSHKHLLIFPEGTRSKGNQMNPFKEGSLKIASLGKSSIIPVSLSNAYCIDDRKDKTKVISISYGKKISFEMVKEMSERELSEHVFHLIEDNVISTNHE